MTAPAHHFISAAPAGTSRRSQGEPSVATGPAQPAVAGSALPVASPQPAVAAAPARHTAPARNINGQAALTARMQGKTGGFAHRGHQLVFASSAPSKSSSPASATGNLWSGVQSGASPSIGAAAASGAHNGGLSSAVLAGLVIFGLGLVGLAGGGAYVVVTGRRRASSTGASKRD